jgi:hypothetical protein
MAYKNWYLTTYADLHTRPIDPTLPPDAQQFQAELLSAFEAGEATLPLLPEGVSADQALASVEHDICNLVYGLDHVDNDSTRSGDIDRDVARLQGIRHALLAAGAVSQMPAPVPEGDAA